MHAILRNSQRIIKKHALSFITLKSLTLAPTCIQVFTRILPTPSEFLKKNSQTSHQKIKDKMDHYQVRVAMLIAVWHKSGNGDSQEISDANDPQFGHFPQERQLRDGDNYASFHRLGGRPHHLYMCHVFDMENILHYTWLPYLMILRQVPLSFRSHCLTILLKNL